MGYKGIALVGLLVRSPQDVVDPCRHGTTLKIAELVCDPGLTTRVAPTERVVVGIRVLVEGLWRCEIRRCRVRLDESATGRVVVAGSQEDQPAVGVVLLA